MLRRGNKRIGLNLLERLAWGGAAWQGPLRGVCAPQAAIPGPVPPGSSPRWALLPRAASARESAASPVMSLHLHPDKHLARAEPVFSGRQPGLGTASSFTVFRLARGLACGAHVRPTVISHRNAVSFTVNSPNKMQRRHQQSRQPGSRVFVLSSPGTGRGVLSCQAGPRGSHLMAGWLLAFDGFSFHRVTP